jgi:hypothetical protein
MVDQVDVSGEEPLLLIGATLITLDQVRSVARPTVPPTGDPDNSPNPDSGGT